jgi:hypothetical protein
MVTDVERPQHQDQSEIEPGPCPARFGLYDAMGYAARRILTTALCRLARRNLLRASGNSGSASGASRFSLLSNHSLDRPVYSHLPLPFTTVVKDYWIRHFARSAVSMSLTAYPRSRRLR